MAGPASGPKLETPPPGERLSKRLTRARVGCAASGVLFLVGSLGAMAGLVKAFGAVSGQSVDPSQSARILSEGITAPMSRTVVFGVVALVGALGMLACWLRQRAVRRQP